MLSPKLQALASQRMGIVLMAISFVLLAAGLIFKFNMIDLASGLPAAQVIIVRQRMDLIGTVLLITAALTTVLRIGLGILRVTSSFSRQLPPKS